MVSADGRAAQFIALTDVFASTRPEVTTVGLAASSRWEIDRAELAESDDAIWGSLPAAGLSPFGALKHAVRRERALRRLRSQLPATLRVRRVHRLQPASHAGRMRRATRSLLLSGLLIELAQRPDAPRAYEKVLAEVGVDSARAVIGVSRDGTVRCRATLGDRPVLIRLASRRSERDPTRAAGALRRLRELGMEMVPRLVAEGHTETVSWTVETLEPGSVPDRLTPSVVAQVVDFASKLALGGGEISAPQRHVATLGKLIPHVRADLAAVLELLQPVLDGMRPVLQHGDLLRDNLLTRGAALSAVVDWDTWEPAGTPGVDLFELFATERIPHRNSDLGSLVTQRAIEDAEFMLFTRPYWDAIGVTPTARLLHGVAVAWWLSALVSLLERPDRRYLADRPEWVDRNVDRVVRWLASNP
jgi:hypothetical protein